MFMKFIMMIFCCLLFRAGAYTQGSVTGKLVDSVSQQPLALGTVSVFKADDTTLITYRMSTPDGYFKIPKLPSGKPLRIIISYSGFSVYRLEFQLYENEEKELGTIRMTPDSKSLEEILVIAERPPVVIKKDTIEFNASAFSTLPTALVEDLLRKLPGVQVDINGNITVNGRKVNRLLVEGKDFFGSDPRMATRNLPANIIDKIQVTDDKDEAELNPEKLPADLGQVVNLKLKKGIKKGWFGKAYAGAGSSDRREAGFIANLFRDTVQLSILGYHNNLDRAGFGINDILSIGGYNRGGLDDYVINSRGVNVNGLSFGGQGDGINTSGGTGFNFNNVLKNGITLNTQYFFGQNRNDILEQTNRQQFIADTMLETLSHRDEVAKTFNHRIGIGLKGNIDKRSRFEFKPALLITEQEVASVRNTGTTDNYKGLLNTGTNTINVQGSSFVYDHSLLYFRNFARKGKSFSLSNTVTIGHSANDLFNTAITSFYDAGASTDSLSDQLRQRRGKNFSANLNANLNQPLTQRFSLRFTYLLAMGSSADDLTTFFKNGGNEKYEIMQPQLSNQIERTSWRNNLSSSLNYSKGALNASLSLSLQTIDIVNEFGKTLPDVAQHYKYIFPGFNIRWNQLSLNYGIGVSPASINDIQPIPDNTNPLYINYGNPALRPTKTHSIRFSFAKNNTQKFVYFRSWLMVNFREDAITRLRTIRPDGVQETRPVNMDGTYNIAPSLDISRQYKFNKNLQFNAGMSADMNISRSYLVINDQRSYMKQFTVYPTAQGSLNWKDKLEMNLTYSPRWTSTHYEKKDFKDLDAATSVLSGEWIIRWPKQVVLETQIDRKYNSQVSPGIQQTVTLWNAAINYLFLPGDKGQLKLAAYDLLKQNRNISSQASENYIQNRQLNMLTQYFLVTFTYNIRDFKPARVGGRQKFFLF